MDDEQIVALYWERSEQAIPETDRKYGNFCRSIADNILQCREDTQECVNDTYLSAWNAMPPHRPSILSAFLGKLARRIALDRLRSRTRLKRGGDTVTLALEELQECLAGGAEPERELEHRELVCALNRFLDRLPADQRRIFLCRYWQLDDIRTIARRYHMTESKVTSMLHRTRKKLRSGLEEEGFL